MKGPFHPSPSAAILLALAAAASCPGITPTEWRFRQLLKVPTPGLVRVDLSAATFDAGGPQMEGLRVVDPAGNEAALLIDRPPVPVAHAIRPALFEVKVDDGSTEIHIATGTPERLSAISLETPNPFFLRAARVEVSQDNRAWSTLDQGVPVFREWGAERLELPLGGRVAAYVRVTLSDKADAPVPFTGARLLLEAAPPPAPSPVESRIARRDEFAGETVLTLSLDGQNIPLASLRFETKEPLFVRRVSISVREVRDALPYERVVGAGTLFRVALDGSPAREQVELPLVFTPHTRELLVHIYNGDSPPLSIDAVRLNRWPVSLLFVANSAGDYLLLSGNPQALAPHYDLAAFAGEMRGAHAFVVVPGGIEETPDYRPSETLGAPQLPDIPLLGAPLDAKNWEFRRSVEIGEAGVQDLELDLDVLCKARTDFADLRLVKEGNQIPFVLEQPALARSLTVSAQEASDPKRPSVSLWRVHLPGSGLPVRSIVLGTTTSLFDRQFRIFERLPAQDGDTYLNTLASGQWSRTPQRGADENRVFGLRERTHADTLWIECDNGDNPAIALGAVQVVYPVVRLVFKVVERDGFALAYGNKEANAPRYDLNLVAERLLTSSRNAAHLGAREKETRAKNPFEGINGGFIFWGALALVVVALLAVVAKLLPKPTG